MRSSCYNEVDPDKIGVKVDISDSFAVYEDKRVNAARKKGVHALIDTLPCKWNSHFCKPFCESNMMYFPEILMYQWYHYVTVLTYYLVREKVKAIPLLTLINVILSNHKYYLFSKEYHDTLWLSRSDFENCINTFNIDTLINNTYLKLALLYNGRDAKELGIPLHLPENSPIYERNKAMAELLKKSVDSDQVYTKDIADLILTYDGDDYIPLVSLDLFGDELFSFVAYIKYNIENVINN